VLLADSEAFKMKWFSLTELLKHYEVFNILLWVSFGFALREQFSTAAYEWSVLIGRRRRRWIHVVYFISKVTYWIGISLMIVGTNTLYRVNCQVVAYLGKAAIALSTLGSSTLLASRAAVIYHQSRYRRTAITLLAVLGLGIAASWIHQISQVNSFWVSGAGKPWTRGSCVILNIRLDEATAPTVTAAFDFIVLLIAIHGIYSLKAGGTAVGKRLLRQHVIYVSVIVIFNAVAIAFLVANVDPVMRLLMGAPLITASMLLSTRLHVELAEPMATPVESPVAVRGPHVHSERSGRSPRTAADGARIAVVSSVVGSEPDLLTRKPVRALSSVGSRASLRRRAQLEQFQQEEDNRSSTWEGGRQPQVSDLSLIEMVPLTQVATPPHEPGTAF